MKNIFRVNGFIGYLMMIFPILEKWISFIGSLAVNGEIKLAILGLSFWWLFDS
jgi:hypothetical protein